MKIAFTTSGESLAAPFNSSFGRSPKFLIYDLNDGSVDIIDNQQNLNAAQGAGIQAAQTVARAGAQVLVSGHCGPKAFRVLSAEGIAVYYASAATVAEALQAYRDGQLKKADAADVESHHA
jgi:predicted Fe-Mo cluster-binding NifX family protein